MKYQDGWPVSTGIYEDVIEEELDSEILIKHLSSKIWINYKLNSVFPK